MNNETTLCMTSQLVCQGHSMKHMVIVRVQLTN